MNLTRHTQAVISITMQVQRCRFVDFVPNGIQSMCYSPDNNWVALVRKNSDIEIWNIHEKFFCAYVSI